MKNLFVAALLGLLLMVHVAYANAESKVPVTQVVENASLSAKLNFDENVITQEEMNRELSRSYYCYSVTKGYPEVQEHYLEVMKAIVLLALFAEQRTTEGMDNVIREVSVSSESGSNACVRKAVFEIIGLK